MHKIYNSCTLATVSNKCSMEVQQLSRKTLKPVEKKMVGLGLGQKQIEKEVSFALLRINQSKNLRQCTANSVMSSVIYAANLGFTLNPEAQECALIARKNRNGQYECTLMPMYQGIANLAFKSGNISQLITQEVREKDNFSLTPNNVSDPVSHSYGFGDRGKPIGYYTLIVFENGSKQVESMDIETVLKIRDMSDGWLYAKKYGKEKNHPWFKWFGEMARKACLKRALKYVNKNQSTEKLLAAIELDNNEYKIQNWQIHKIEDLLRTSTFDDEYKARIEGDLHDLSAVEARKTIESLELHQIPDHPGYNDRVNQTQLDKQIASSVNQINT